MEISAHIGMGAAWPTDSNIGGRSHTQARKRVCLYTLVVEKALVSRPYARRSGIVDEPSTLSESSCWRVSEPERFSRGMGYSRASQAHARTKGACIKDGRRSPRGGLILDRAPRPGSVRDARKSIHANGCARWNVRSCPHGEPAQIFFILLSPRLSHAGAFQNGWQWAHSVRERMGTEVDFARSHANLSIRS